MSVLCVAPNPTIDLACETDRVEPIHKIRTRDVRLYPGGGGVNVARVLATLGDRPFLLTMAGGAQGTLLDARLAAFDIDHRTVPIEGETRVAFIAHDTMSDLEYRFVPDGPALERRELAAFETAFGDALRSAPRWVVLSGSLPRGVPSDTYVRLARVARESGARVALDTSGEPLRAALAAGGLDLVKPSLRELESIDGAPLDEAGVRLAAERLVSKGSAARVAVTLGMQGSLLALPGRSIRRPALHVPVHSATGAGDSFTAGLVHGLDRGMTEENAFALALACGAATVMTPGTELCGRADVERLLGAQGVRLFGGARATEAR